MDIFIYMAFVFPNTSVTGVIRPTSKAVMCAIRRYRVVKAGGFGGPVLACLALLGLMSAARGQQPPILDLQALDPPGQITLMLHGEAGADYAIEVSRNLNFWLPLTSATATNGQMDFQYSPGTNTQTLFFRGRLNVKLPPINVSVQTDTNDQTITLITPGDGGSLSLIDTHGVTYTLTVPPHAVFDSEVVTMTVVTNLGGLPFASGLLGGVAFTPDNLRFAQAAQLVIQFPTNRPIDTRTVAGYAFDGDGSYLRLVPTVPGSNSLMLPITSLSGLACSVATLQEIQQQAQRIVSDTNNVPPSGLALQGRISKHGPYYDSCYPAEKFRATSVNLGLENALRPIQQDLSARLGEARQAQLLGVDTPSVGDMGLQTAAESFYKDYLAQYADELKTNCALVTVVSRYTLGIERQAQLMGLDSPIPDSFLDVCSILPECAQKILECCKTKGASQQALSELLGLTRQAELLGCADALPQDNGDCYPGWAGTITYQDTRSYYQTIGSGECDNQYQLTATFFAENLIGQPTGQGYYSVGGTVSGPAEGKNREHCYQPGDCCYCYLDTLHTSAVQTNVNANLSLVWAITNVPPSIQNGLLLFPDPNSVAVLAAIAPYLTTTDSHGDADCKPIVKIDTTHDLLHGVDSYPIEIVMYNSPTITGTLNQVTGSYATNWTGTDGTQYSQKVSWDLRRKQGP